jgi:hypothetical protein
MNTLPEKFQEFLGNYGPKITDPTAGVEIGWGYDIMATLGEDLWNELSQYGRLEYVRTGPGRNDGIWYFIDRWLTRREAIDQYGPVKAEVYGPRGGWKSVTFGATTFTSPLMKSTKPLLCPACHSDYDEPTLCIHDGQPVPLIENPSLKLKKAKKESTGESMG